MFFMMVFATAFTSGFLLAASSIEKICLQMADTYSIEDGRFECDFEPDQDALDAAAALGVTITEDFYTDTDMDLGQAGDKATNIVVRIYPPRSKRNRA